MTDKQRLQKTVKTLEEGLEAIEAFMKRTQGDISDVSAISLVRLVRECRNGLRYNVTHCITICSEGLNKKTKREAYSNLIDLLEKNIS